ncbi:ErfK/YbiS/YcfS/YnhG family protein [hydrothermal vent metagenome]|uniref:ErfK/YbiS/YcfS/YnhG family protein n=1 Tax=hydrothermal vent metagenome TaxID=652676 RepID=A0A1W1CCW9_9ZZZZ
MKIKLFILAIIGLFVFNACNEPVTYGKADKTAYPTAECIKELSIGAELKGPQIDRIAVYKKQRKMYTYSHGTLMHEFRISLGKNADKGNKIKAGDYRTPEGSYTIVRKKCDNRLYKSLMISYPNKEDMAMAAKRGVKPGGYITIHGQPKWNADGHGDAYTLAHDWTEGCMAVPNKAMDMLWQAVANGVKIDIHP